MTQVMDFEDYVEKHTLYDTAELICVKCYKRWIGCWPTQTLLKNISCPYCNTKGTVITTGQILQEDDYYET